MVTQLALCSKSGWLRLQCFAVCVAKLGGNEGPGVANNGLQLQGELLHITGDTNVSGTSD